VAGSSLRGGSRSSFAGLAGLYRCIFVLEHLLHSDPRVDRGPFQLMQEHCSGRVTKCGHRTCSSKVTIRGISALACDGLAKMPIVHRTQASCRRSAPARASQLRPDQTSCRKDSSPHPQDERLSHSQRLRQLAIPMNRDGCRHTPFGYVYVPALGRIFAMMLFDEFQGQALRDADEIWMSSSRDCGTACLSRISGGAANSG
jgi:hypothetical protein